MMTPIGSDRVPDDGSYADGLDARPGRREPNNNVTVLAKGFSCV